MSETFAYILKPAHRHKAIGRSFTLNAGHFTVTMADPFHVLVGPHWAAYCGPDKDDLLQRVVAPLHPKVREALRKLNLLEKFEPTSSRLQVSTDEVAPLPAPPAAPTPARQSQSIVAPDPAPPAPPAPHYVRPDPVQPIARSHAVPVPFDVALAALRGVPVGVTGDRTIGADGDRAPEHEEPDAGRDTGTDARIHTDPGSDAEGAMEPESGTPSEERHSEPEHAAEVASSSAEPDVKPDVAQPEKAMPETPVMNAVGRLAKKRTRVVRP